MSAWLLGEGLALALGVLCLIIQVVLARRPGRPRRRARRPVRTRLVLDGPPRPRVYGGLGWAALRRQAAPDPARGAKPPFAVQAGGTGGGA